MDKLFHIFELTEDLVKDIRARDYEAHLHDFEELIIVTRGSLVHFIDFEQEKANAPFFCYISMGKMHKLIPHEDLRGWVINYKPEFMPDSKLSFYSNFFTSTNIPLSSASCINQYSNLCKLIEDGYKHEPVDYASLRNLLSGLISMIEAERKNNMPVETVARASQIETFNRFLKILEENFKQNEGVSFYAEKMNMSERNLNIISKNNFQKSVSEIIETRKLIEAKRLLLHTNKSVSEIGFELGYNEKSYFTRVFHNKMSITPSQFREMSQSIIS
ncbi:MAG: AraC family transcriptional regulator [Paludibacteraceae bacterium]|nr:AraC family transcriptional regulator [Paludibacteraceae bacterium]